MKLNKTEIYCLANKLTKELNDAIQERNEKAIKEYKASAKYTKFMETVDLVLSNFSKVEKTIGLCRPSILNKTELSTRFIRKELGIDKCLWIINSDIADKITLAQIECPSLNDIIEKIKAEYLD